MRSGFLMDLSSLTARNSFSGDVLHLDSINQSINQSLSAWRQITTVISRHFPHRAGLNRTLQVLIYCDSLGHYVLLVVRFNNTTFITANLYGYNSKSENDKLLDVSCYNIS